MTSDNPSQEQHRDAESTSDNWQPRVEQGRWGRRPVPLSASLEAVHTRYVSQTVHTRYVSQMSSAPLDDDTRRAYVSRVRQYLAWLATAEVDGDPLDDEKARDGAVRDYRTYLQTCGVASDSRSIE